MASCILTLMHNRCRKYEGPVSEAQFNLRLDWEPDRGIDFKFPFTLQVLALVIQGKPIKMQTCKAAASRKGLRAHVFCPGVSQVLKLYFSCVFRCTKRRRIVWSPLILRQDHSPLLCNSPPRAVHTKGPNPLKEAAQKLMKVVGTEGGQIFQTDPHAL